ncbi:MAG: hypothetical protein AB2L14_12945 [Candidatus Xenobiia bacterium LiM19]
MTKFFFQDLMEEKSLVSLYDFENRERLFPAVDSRMKFCLFTLSGRQKPSQKGAEFVFFTHNTSQLNENERRFVLSASDIALLNPNTRTCPVFRYKKDAELTKMIYQRVPILIKETYDSEGKVNSRISSWNCEITRTFDMSKFSEVSKTIWNMLEEGYTLKGTTLSFSEEWIPILEAKTFSQFDHRFATYKIQPIDICIEMTNEDKLDPHQLVLGKNWLKKNLVCNYMSRHKDDYVISYRNIVRNTDIRTMISSILPKLASDYSVRIVFSGKLKAVLSGLFVSNLNTFCFDYTARQSVAGTNFSDYIMKQLPVLPPDIYYLSTPWGHSKTLAAWIFPLVLELIFTAWDLEPFAKDCGYDGPPFKWDEERRFLMRCELDAAYFHLYEIERDDVDYIMETFPIVKRKDIDKHGEYRTKRVILEIYDKMKESMTSGKPYETLLDPPPADLGVAHPPREVKVT